MGPAVSPAKSSEYRKIEFGNMFRLRPRLALLFLVKGQMGIFPQHIRLMTQLAPDEVNVRKDDHDDFLAVGEGLIRRSRVHCYRYGGYGGEHR
jgi:hypothetical protein